MKTIAIVPKTKAISLVNRIADKNTLCYYLDDDYECFTNLRAKFADRIKIRNLSGIYDGVFQEIRGPLMELLSEINKEHDSHEWWGGQLASKNTMSSPLIVNITYLFCVKKILLGSGTEFVFITGSHALSDCISDVAAGAGCKVVSYKRNIDEYLLTLRRYLYYAAQIMYFFWIALQNRRAALKLLKPLAAKKSLAKQRVVIRTWITKGSFDESGKYSDRNFGLLPEWLHSKNYDVWILPMFFSLRMPFSKIYALMKNLRQPFLIPEHYLKCSDYLEAAYNAFLLTRKSVDNAEILATDVTPIFNETLREKNIGYHLILLNLCYPMLKRLSEKGYEIDGFYYPFENNPPEKLFILGCRKYFLGSRIVGFQHTTFFSNQLAYHLAPGEKDYHPLPDKIVCSGPIYIHLHEKAGFPHEMLEPGPNLRFASVYMAKTIDTGKVETIKEKTVLLPLTFSHDLAFELFVKVNESLKGNRDFKVWIRTHPLLSKKKLVKFLDKIGMNKYEFTDNGIIQEWLSRSYAVITTGASITIVEATSMGVPVIRVIPDNTFFFDPFTWANYPLKPVSTSLGIKQQINFINQILGNDREAFKKIANQVLKEYFTKPDEENLKVFL